MVASVVSHAVPLALMLLLPPKVPERVEPPIVMVTLEPPAVPVPVPPPPPPPDTATEEASSAASAPAPAPPAPVTRVRATAPRRPPPIPPPPEVRPLPAPREPAPAPMVTLGEAELAGATRAGSGLSGGQGGNGSGTGEGNGNGGCDMVQRLQDALRTDPEVRQAVAQAQGIAGAGRTPLVWNGRWVQTQGEEGEGLAGVRQAIALEVAFAPAACKSQRMRGMVLIAFSDARGGPRVALGTGSWRWSDLLNAR